MKYLKWAIGGVLLAAVPLAMLPILAKVAGAQRFSTNIDRHELVRSSVFSSGKDIDIRGTIDGDVFCAGQNINVDAIVNGDVICAGQNVTVSGQVNGSVRLAGQQVTILADIGNDATVAAQDFALKPGARIGRDLVVTAKTQALGGETGRDVLARGDSITLSSVVGRDLNAASRTLHLTSDALVADDLTFAKDGKLIEDKGASVQGETTRSSAGHREGALLGGAKLLMYLFLLLGLLLVGWVLSLFFPQVLHKTCGIVRANIGKVFLVGLLGNIAALIIILALGLSLIGSPLALALLVAWIFAQVLSGPIAAYCLGRFVLRDKVKSQPLAVLVGSVILTGLYIIPYAGMILLAIAWWIGFGSLLLALKQHIRPRPPKEALKAEPAPLPAP